MSGWKERLQKEHAELDERTNSLSDFFGKAESAELDIENFLLLRRQLRAMREYLRVLEQRMELNGMGPDCEECGGKGWVFVINPQDGEREKEHCDSCLDKRPHDKEAAARQRCNCKDCRNARKRGWDSQREHREGE